MTGHDWYQRKDLGHSIHTNEYRVDILSTKKYFVFLKFKRATILLLLTNMQWNYNFSEKLSLKTLLSNQITYSWRNGTMEAMDHTVSHNGLS